MVTLSLQTVYLIISIFISIVAVVSILFKLFKKIDKIDKIDTILEEISFLKNLANDVKDLKDKSEERGKVLYDLKDNVHDISIQLDGVTEETKFNTSMCKADTEVLEALADHAITTQHANGKVHRSLEVIEKLKYNNPKFS